ncbi:MAG TPA: hypothetical protein VE077_17555 [Candidatus Methylomirabilis sp.]|nr:hypothetical protein [Candidatus Methylomirabilis sp.]
MLLAVLCGSADAQEKLSDLQARFDNETNPVHKAKLIQRLGDAEFEEAGRAERAGDFSSMGLLLEKYRDNVQSACDALEKNNPDGEHHPNGYKQLEMHVQKALREMDDFLLEAPDPYKPPLQLVRKDLVKLDDVLLRSLFPKHHNAKPPAEKPPTPTAGSPNSGP